MGRLRNKFKTNYRRVSFLIVLGICVLGSLLLYVQQNLIKSRAGIETSTATINFIAPDVVAVNNEFDLTLNILAPTQQKISALDLYLKFDDNSNLIDFVNVSVYPAGNTTSQYFNEPPLIQDVQQFGNAKVLHVVAHDQFKQNLSNYSNNIRIVFRLKAKAVGSTRFEILKNVSGVFGSKETSIDTLSFALTPEVIQKSLTINGTTVSPTMSPTIRAATPTVHITPTIPVGSTRVNLKARFQGIIQTPPKGFGVVRVTFTPSGSGPITQEVNGTFTSDGIWQGQTFVPLSQNSVSYKVHVQAPKYLKKRFCEKHPVAKNDTYTCNDSRIVLSASENILDFTSVHQLVGDTHAPFGVIDTVDIVSLRSALNTRDGQKIALYDFNYNNTVEVQDYSLVIKALSIQNTEDE